MSDVHLMLQENILRFKNPDNLKHIFDLKGSLVNREVRGKIKSSTTLKDVNFLQETKADENLMSFDKWDRIKLLRALRKDVDFLRQNGIMDYSLLLGIEETEVSIDKDVLHVVNAPRYTVRRLTSVRGAEISPRER